MEWANFEGDKIRATPNSIGYCAGCGTKLTPRCGLNNKWHWAHPPKTCDPWYEPESKWHINWKNLFPKEQQEVRMEDHRADIKGKNYVVELQHSPISTDEIYERENFYRDMIWIFDLREPFKKGHFTIKEQDLSNDPYPVHYSDWEICQWSWSWMRKSIISCKAPVLLHLEKGLLLNVYNFQRKGYAHRISKSSLLNEVNGDPVGLLKTMSFSPILYKPNELYEMRGFGHHRNRIFY